MTTIEFPGVENGGWGLMVVLRSVEGAGCGGDQDRRLSLSSTVITTSGEEMSLIIVIPQVENGGCMEEGGILGLRGTVETNVEFRWGWQWQDHQCSHSGRVGVIQYAHVKVLEAQKGVGVAAVAGHRCTDLNPALPPY